MIKTSDKSAIILLIFFLVLGTHHTKAGVTLIQTFTEKNTTGTSRFGYSVSGAGDVNGDNFDDVIVGANGYNSETGRAYVYFGAPGTSMDNTPDVTMTGEGTYNRFGYSVSGAGDVNGDNFDDVIVGAFRYGSYTGRAYIYFGAPGTSMDNVADVTLTGEGTYNYFGSSVSGAGDVNGDNYDDVIVGAYYYNSETGRAYVYFGATGTTMDNTADVTMTGEGTNNRFGISVSGAGDVNGDTFDDVIVGAYGYNSYTGRATIYFGAPGTGMDADADVTMDGEGTYNYFGYSVSGAGDVNGDTFDDVIVGAYGNSSGTGRAYIYFGAAGTSMDNVADVTMTGEGTYNYFGYSVSGAGDVNGDTNDDVIVGAYRYGSYTGRATIYFGAPGTGMDNVADVTMTGEGTNNRFGISVSEAGDVNGDTFDDVIVGAWGYDSSTGRAYIYFGAPGTSMDNTADVTMTGEVTDNWFGYSVSGAGDVNGDTYDDVIVGACYYSSLTGRAYVYFGAPGTSMDNTPDVTMTGEGTDNRFGWSVSGAGDVNGDNYDDVIVGARGYSSSTGRAYVYFGAPGTSMDNTPDVTMTGEGTNNRFGISVSGAGDVNGDNFDDVIVGAYGYNSGTGRAYIYFGAPGTGMDNTADVTMTGEGTGNLFGYSVSGAGDVNGDTFDDVIVGAYYYNSITGRAYVYFGAPGTGMDDVADVTMTGEGTSNRFGWSVSGAGDVNGDNFDDVVVGAPYHNSYTGRATIYFGAPGTSMDNVADVTMTGEGTNNAFGWSVSGAGDVNGDNFDDVIVGADGYNSGTGRATIYFGAAGTTMDNVADVTMTGEGTSNSFGISVSGAGDLNGDNVDDVIVGAYHYPGNGKAYVFRGEVQSVRLTSHIDGVYMGGSPSRIEWVSSMPNAGRVTLRLSTDGGQTYPELIGEKLPNNGFHVWQMPLINNQFCRIKIEIDLPGIPTDTSPLNFTIDSTPPDVSMTNPTSGQTWYGGSTYDITWTATDNFGLGTQAGESAASKEGTPDQTLDAGPVSIQYSFDNWTSDKYYTICAGEANDGLFTWTVPMSLVGSTLQLKVRVVDAAGNVTCGHCDEDIEIIAPPTPIAIIAPNGSETFAAGSSQKITWTSNVPSGRIDLYYSMDGGDSYPNLITEDEANDGELDWTVPDINTQSLRIKAVLSGPINQEDVSDSDLTVDGLAPVVELTSPSTGLTIEAGGSVDITWTAQDNFDLEEKPISLFYSTDGGKTFPNAIVQSVENNGKYMWNVPTDLNSSKVRLRVEAVDKAGLKASSSSKQNMTIAPLTLALTYPNGGEVFQGGSTKTITWASTLSEGTVTLRYTTDGGKTWPHTIATNEENDGQYDWTLPGLNSKNVSIKITLQSAHLHEDQANGEFTIDSTPPSIGLQSFTGGDSVEAGGKYEIQWKAVDNFGLKENAIAIRYSDDGGLTYPHTIAEDLENKSTYIWTTPKHLNTDKVRLKIETQDQAGQVNSNVSPSSFTVMPLIITVTQPNGGELWNGMTQQTIKWTSNFNSGFVTLRYSTNGGQTWPHTIASGLENQLRKYDWEVPQINAEQVKLKAELTLQNQTSDESNHFKIQHHAPEVTIIYPIGGETWEANSTNEIRWTADDAHFDLKDNPINVLFSKDCGKTFNDTIAIKVKNDSLLYWTTPRDLNSSEVRIKVEAENVREVKGYDVIDEDMAILNPPPVLTEIPDISFENTGAAYFNLNPYVSDNNDRLIELTWSGWCEEPKIEIIINNENKWCTIIAREITGLFDVVLTATDPWGDSASDTLQIDVSGPTSVQSPVIASGPTEFVLEQNVPNPFNPQTTLRYGLPEDSEIQILVFNMAGKQVAELYNGHQSKGYHTVTWHALDQPTGVYFIRMMAGDFHDMRKCVLMK